METQHFLKSYILHKQYNHCTRYTACVVLLHSQSTFLCHGASHNVCNYQQEYICNIKASLCTFDIN